MKEPAAVEMARRLSLLLRRHTGLAAQVRALTAGERSAWELVTDLPPLALGWESREEAVCLVIFGSDLAQTLVDRLLGGRGAWPKRVRILTPLEQRVLRPLVGSMVSELVASLPGATRQAGAKMVQPEGEAGALARELLVRFPDRRLVVVAFEVVLPVGRGRIWVALDPDRLRAAPAAAPAAEAAPAMAARKPAAVSPAAGGRAVVSVVLGEVTLTATELLGLECGDIIRLPQPAHGELPVLLNGRVAGTGLPGVYHGRVAVRLTRSLGGEDAKPGGAEAGGVGAGSEVKKEVMPA
ncbi:MAG TPA: hypothetical protein GXX55_01305 [Firmicutes bacterium]|nr:hypothetical protein [Bacillota bacterium]